MKALIVDDEPIARRVLREELELLTGVLVVGEAGDGRDALQKISSLRPDVVFLDLQMPVMSGFEVVRNLSEPPLPVIVIVTAYDQHAIQAFEAGAIDYLLKPVSEARLRIAVERARNLQGKPADVAERIDKIASAAESSNAPRSTKVVGRSGEEYFFLDGDDVPMIEKWMKARDFEASFRDNLRRVCAYRKQVLAIFDGLILNEQNRPRLQ